MTHSLWLEALLDPAGIFVLLIAVAAGLLAAWWLFPVGVLLWFVIAVRVLNDPALRLNETIQNRRDMAQRFQPAFDRVQRSQVTIFNTLSSAEPGVRRALLPVQASLNRLVDEIYTLCRRFTPMENNRLISAPPATAAQDIAQLDGQAQNTTDPIEKQKYLDQAQTLRQRMDQYHSASEQLDHFDAELATMAAEMDMVVSEVTQILALDRSQMKPQVKGLAKKIDQKKTELTTFK